MKKKILLFSHGMELGGAERALLALLEHMDLQRFDVDLFLMHHEGELFSQIPKGIRLLPELPQYASLAVPMGHVIRKGQLAVAAARVLGKYRARRRVKQLGLPSDNGVALEYSHKYTLPVMPRVGEEQYDLAVSFLTPHYFVANRVQAKKKVAWIHTDYSKVAVDAASELKMWMQYDHVISISDAVTDAFCSVFPELKDRIVTIENMLPGESIVQQAQEQDGIFLDDGCIRLLSVGRFCTAKNFDNVPEICRLILDTGLNVKWYLIGFGGDEALIRQRIAEAGMQGHVIILGKKSNPYPYIKACDLYVQPSRYEGNCVCVHEAQILGKPVVITKYATSASQLEDGVDGVIVPMDNEGCAAGIAALLRNEQKLEVLRSACRSRDYSNSQEIEKLYKLIQ